MLLKRHYEADALAEWLEQRNAAVAEQLAALPPTINREAVRQSCEQQYADEHGLPAIAYVEIKRGGENWRPSTGLIERGVEEGWLSVGDGKVTIKTGADDGVYRIVRGPGRYCCHCNARLAGEVEAKAHVEQHQGQSPDANNPSGYRLTTYYECVREQANG